MHRALGLFGSGQFPVVAEHIDSGQLEAAVGAHCLTQRCGLAPQRGFFHHMARKRKAVALAPFSDLIGKGLGKTLRNMVMIMISGYRDRRSLPLPEYFRQTV